MRPDVRLLPNLFHGVPREQPSSPWTSKNLHKVGYPVLIVHTSHLQLRKASR